MIKFEMMNKSSRNNCPLYKRIVWGILITFFTTVVLINGWQFYKDSNPQSYISFAQYAPSKIVDNLQVSSTALEVWTSNIFTSFSPYSINAVLSLNRSDSYISETQYKITHFDSTCDAVNVNCFNKTTPNGQTYQLSLYRDPNNLQAQPLVYDKLTSQQVIFVKNNTRIQIVVKSQSDIPIPDGEWNDMIDSFKPTVFNDLRIKHMHPGP